MDKLLLIGVGALIGGAIAYSLLYSFAEKLTRSVREEYKDDLKKFLQADNDAEWWKQEEE